MYRCMVANHNPKMKILHCLQRGNGRFFWKTKQNKNADPDEWKSYLEDSRIDDRLKNKLSLGVHKWDDNRFKSKLTSKLERDMPESYAECNPGGPKEYSENVSKKKKLSQKLLFGIALNWLLEEKLGE
ncbi:hypothetical protein NPIL_585741 [Nephila pilipes]|uniref:Uncharacterized protein n=1 Tax=Nephila pilipes TaxID=299642 RepID=A0A8X6N6Q7_NEPPI|nr:hypothetical protein NPIL_585741 [Nephila pilipes]